MVTANREVALNRESQIHLGKVFANVLSAKILLGCIAFVIFIASFFLISKVAENSLLFYLGFSIVIGRILMPNWFFQGLEQMKTLSLINLFSQILFIILIFIFVKYPKDYVLVLFLQGVSYSVASLVGLVWGVSKYLKRKDLVFDLKGTIHQLKSSFPVFIISISSISYNNANIFILGLFTSNTLVGYFSIADKVITLFKQCIGGLGIALLPHISRLTEKTYKEVELFFQKFYSIIVIGIIILSMLIAIFSNEIIFMLMGHHQIESEKILSYLSGILIIIILNSIPYLILLSYDEKKNVSFVITIGCILNLFFNFLLVPLLKIKGTILSMYITEIFIFIGYFFILLKAKKHSKLVSYESKIVNNS
jgi:PST family polysaccharide transporter